MIERTYVERVLIVFGPDGAVHAAHQERLKRIEGDDGGVIAEKSHGAEPLEPETLAQLVGDRAALLAETAQLRTRVEMLEKGGAAALVGEPGR